MSFSVGLTQSWPKRQLLLQQASSKPPLRTPGSLRPPHLQSLWMTDFTSNSSKTGTGHQKLAENSLLLSLSSSPVTLNLLPNKTQD